MPLWGNTDAANSIPLFSQLRTVREVVTATTANTTLAGNTIVFTSNANFSSIQTGNYVYAIDAVNGLTNATSRMAKDLSIVDQNDIDFYASNNTVTIVDPANNIVKFANPIIGLLSTGSTVWFANAINHGTATLENVNDVILVTPTRLANTQGTTGAAGSTVANTQLGNMSVGWNRIVRKINNDGTIRFLKETLVALANPVAANTQSANTSANAIFGGL